MLQTLTCLKHPNHYYPLPSFFPYSVLFFLPKQNLLYKFLCLILYILSNTLPLIGLPLPSKFSWCHFFFFSPEHFAVCCFSVFKLVLIWHFQIIHWASNNMRLTTARKIASPQGAVREREGNAAAFAVPKQQVLCLLRHPFQSVPVTQHYQLFPFAILVFSPLGWTPNALKKITLINNKPGWTQLRRKERVTDMLINVESSVWLI